MRNRAIKRMHGGRREVEGRQERGEVEEGKKGGLFSCIQITFFSQTAIGEKSKL